MHNLVPRFILEKYSQGKNSGQLHAVCLFADISGFSAATHALMQHGDEAAESMADVMLRIFEPLVSLVHAQGGFITTFAGDAFTAIFPTEGEPASYQHALAAAISIQKHMIANPIQTSPYGNFPFAIKLGLGDGVLEWGILRPEQELTNSQMQRAAYFFSGPAIQAAASAEHQAQSGNIILTQTVYSHLQDTLKVLQAGDGYWRCLTALGELPSPQLPSPNDSLAAIEAAFIPRTITERDSTGDFRQVVSVFIQLMGIETRQDLDIFMQAVFSLLHQMDGYLNRVDFGDKGCNLLLYWGMPTSHENDIQRALDFVLELGNHTPGSFRAGLTYRPMYAGLSGSDERGEYTCYGDGINLAARLMIAAPWGGLWADERIASRAKERFVFEYVDHLAFKGFSEKQAVYNLIERRPLGESFFEGQMVGRQAELAELNTFVQPIFASEDERRYAGLLAVIGEAGLGKSRLVQEFLTSEYWPIRGAAQVFVCQTDQVLRQSLNPFRHWLLHYFNQASSQSAERNKRAFSRKLDLLIASQADADLSQELNRTRSFLGALVGLEWESSLYARLDPKSRYENTLQALKTLLKAESRRQPVVLVLEDAQWLDEDSQMFIRRLGHEIETYPLAVLATARPERAGALFGPGCSYQPMDLSSFSAEDLLVLAQDRLGGQVSANVLELLTKRAESNPFFVEQILLYLSEQNKLTYQDGVWNLAATDGETSLPNEVRNIFIARLDRLSKEIQNVVQAASILGREFEVRVLAHILKIDHHGDGLPDELAAQMVSAEHEAIWAALNQVRYLFKHTLLRDAAYDMQLKARRRELHSMAAVSLEHLRDADLATGSRQLDEYVSQIAHHYEAAYRQGLKDVLSLACHYLEKAAQHAAQRYENTASLDWLARALELTPATALEERLRLLFQRETIYQLLGRRNEQRGDLKTLQEIIQTRRQPSEQAELALREARLANVTGDYARSQTQAQAAIAAAQIASSVDVEASAEMEWCATLVSQGDYSAAREHGQAGIILAEAAERKDLQANGLRQLGSIANFQGDYPAAIAYHEQSLGICREIGDRQGETRALNSLGNIACYLGDYPLAHRHYSQSLAICRETGLRREQGIAFNNLGIVAFDAGDYSATRQYYEQALSIFREIGDRNSAGMVIGNLGLVASNQGDYSAARQYCQQALSISRELRNKRGEGIALNNLGDVASATGDYIAARQHYEQFQLISQEIGYRTGESWACTNLGYLDLTLNDPKAAQKFFEQALEITTGLDLPHYTVENLAGLARASQLQANLGEVRKHVDAILPILESNPMLDGAEHPQRALLDCARVLLALNDARGREIVVQAHAHLQEKAASMDESTRRMFLEGVPGNRELLIEFARLNPEITTPPDLQVQEPAVRGELDLSTQDRKTLKAPDDMDALETRTKKKKDKDKKNKKKEKKGKKEKKKKKEKKEEKKEKKGKQEKEKKKDKKGKKNKK